MRQTDICLDAGGGRNPGEYRICVVERHEPALWLGPIRVTAKDVSEFEKQATAANQVQVRIKLTRPVAGALAGLTENSVGQEMDIRIGGELIRSIRVAAAIETPEFIMVLTTAQADTLETFLASQTR